MSITTNAEELRRNTQDRAELTAQTRVIISDINARLLDAKKNGDMYLSYDLPSVFNVQYMKNAQAQTHVYAAVIRALNQKGFNSRIHIKNKDYTLYITWMTAQEVEEIRKDDQFVKQNLITDERVKEIMADGLIKQ